MAENSSGNTSSGAAGGSNNRDVKYKFSGDSSSLNAAAQSAVKMLNRLDAAARRLQTRIQGATAAFNSNATGAQKVSSSASRAAKYTYKVAESADKAAKSSKNAKKATDDLNSSLDKNSKISRTVTSALSKLYSAARTFLSGKLLADAVTYSIEYIETLNMFNVALGELTTTATKFVNTMSEQLGLDPAEIMRSVGTYQNLAQSMGMTAETAYLLSENFTKLGIDMSSLWNTTATQSLGALESALVGLSKPIRQYGVDITMASLRQTAMELGLSQSVDTMSRANKVGLIYITVMRRASSSMGDFARTIESPANQLRVLQQQFKVLSRAIGDFFLGTISQILPYLNGVVMALSAILRTLANLMGIKVGDFGAAIGGVADSVGAVGDSADDTASKMKQLVAPFDELNILAEDTAASAGGDIGFGGTMDPAILKAMKQYDNLMESVQMKATKIRDRIMETLGFTKHINEETGEITWTWNFNDMIKGLKQAWEDIVKWFTSLSPGGKIATIVIGSFLAYWGSKGVMKIASVLFRPFTILISKIPSLVTTLGTSFSGLTGVISAPFIAAVAAITLVVLALVDLWNNSESFREQVTTSLDELMTRLGEWGVQLGLMFQVLLEGTQKFLDYLVQTFKPMFKAVWTFVKDVVGNVVLGLLDILNGLTEFLEGVFTADIEKVLNGLKKMFGGVFQALVGLFFGGVNLIIKAVNGLIDILNKFKVDVPDWGIFGDMAGQTFGFDIEHIAEIEIPDMSEVLGYARGGYPDRGQLFRAGENGNYEMIGSHQGKTTVMPLENTDFTKAMQDAVRRGVTQAMSYAAGLGGSGQPIEVVVRIGDKDFDDVVYKSYNRAQRSRGARIYGGALNDAT